MNRQITRVAGVAMGLLVALIVATTYWQTWARPALGRAPGQRDPARGAVRDQARADPLARPGCSRATRSASVGGRTLYFRRYPQGRLTAHVVGYSTAARSRAGLERSLNAVLTGSDRGLVVARRPVARQAEREADRRRHRRDDARPQRPAGRARGARQPLRRRRRARSAHGPRARDGLVAELQPERRRGRTSVGSRRSAPTARRPRRCSTARAQGLYPPGSTFKVVTASAALDSRQVHTRRRPSYDPGYCTVYGKRVNNFDTISPFGTVSLATALQYSVNSVFCNIGLSARRQAHPQAGEGVRLLRAAAARDARERAAAERSVPKRRAVRPEARPRRRRGPDGVRPGAAARDAAADGDGCRHDRQRRHPDAPVRRRQDRDAERQDPQRGRSRRRSGGPSRPRRRATSAR